MEAVPTVICAPQQADTVYNGLNHVLECTSDASSIGSTINRANYGFRVPISCLHQAKTLLCRYKSLFASDEEALDDITAALRTIDDITAAPRTPHH